MEKPTRQAVMESPAVHSYCKDILRGSVGKDPLDALHDAELAVRVLRNEYDAHVAHWEGVLSAQGR